jgi:hypothetical protein
VTLSLDVLIGTLVFLLPGFIAVGVYAYVGRFFSRPDLNKTSFILVALTLTLPLLLVFNSLVSPIGKGAVAQVSLSERKPDYVAPRFLISLTALYDLAGAAGGIAGFMFNGTQTLRRRRDVIAAQLSTRVVWSEVVAFRAAISDVIAILEHCSYQRFLQCATSGAIDAYIYIVQPHFLPLGSGKKPDY